MRARAGHPSAAIWKTSKDRTFERSKPAFPQWRRLADAATFALAIHVDQVRKGAGTPYIGHLLGVASLVLEYDGDEDQAIAGLLHDAIEDQGAEQEGAILERFGLRVAAIVRGCTDADTLPKPPWQARKEAYIAHLEHASADILLVSAADKLNNSRAICSDLHQHGLAVYERFTAGKTGTLWFFGLFGRRLRAYAARRIVRGTDARRPRDASPHRRAGAGRPAAA